LRNLLLNSTTRQRPVDQPATGNTGGACAARTELPSLQRPLALFDETPLAGESPVQHLDQNAVARRWRISPRSLERWRWLRQGPPYLKVGGRVLYRLADIEAYERSQLHLVSQR
jgi:hypothetical protein